MAETTQESKLSAFQLILIPSVITLVVTIVRLVGELQHWSEVFFKRSAGGMGAIIGIAWLPVFFGPYFAMRLAGGNQGPKSAGKTIGFAVLGVVLYFAGGFVGFAPQLNFPGKIAVGLLLMVAASAVQFLAWPALAKTLLAYAYAARIPVLIVMYLAITGNWGTHYDAVSPPGISVPVSF
jgi:hypothetical protein